MIAYGLSLRDLEYVVKTAELEHFGKAALACHVSQPSLSTAIKKIEDLLEVQIFERTKRSVRVTPQGLKIVEQSKKILQEALTLENMSKTKLKPLEGVFKIGAIASIGPFLFPEILAPLRKKYPHLQLQIREGLTEHLLEDLKKGILDGVIASPTFSKQGYEFFSLYYEKFFVGCPKGHPLLKGKKVTIKDLKEDEMIFLEDGHCMKDQALEICNFQGKKSEDRLQASSLETLRALVASGHGISLFPESAIKRSKYYQTLLEYRPLEPKGSENPGREVIFVIRENSPVFPHAKEFTNWIRERVKQGTLFFDQTE